MPIMKSGAVSPEKKLTTIVLYGDPGSYKTSMSLTADNAILLDFNEGSYRAQDITNKTRFMMKSWQEVEQAITNADLDDFDTIIIDTTKDCLKYCSDALIEEMPALKEHSGALSIKGYMALAERFSEKFMKKFSDKVLIFLAHDKIISENDFIIHTPDSGGPGGMLLSKAELIGFVRKTDKGEVIIEFRNNMAWISKDPAELGTITVPHYSASEWPTFMQKSIIDPLVARLSQKVKNAENDTLVIKAWGARIGKCSDVGGLADINTELAASGLTKAVRALIGDILVKKQNTITPAMDYVSTYRDRIKQCQNNDDLMAVSLEMGKTDAISKLDKTKIKDSWMARAVALGFKYNAETKQLEKI